MGKCERCGVEPEGEYGLHDYCGECGKDLCAKCMANGCCGVVPALSGEGRDHTEEKREQE